MGKAVSKGTLNAAVNAVFAGASMAEAQAKFGVNYSQLWLHGQAVLVFAGVVAPITGATNTALAAGIAHARAEGNSWGLVAVRASMPESRVRKVFAEATGISSQGTRNGKGGRWVADNPAFYTGGPRASKGTELAPTVPVLAQVPAPDAPATYKLPTVAKRLVSAAGRARPVQGKRTGGKGKGTDAPVAGPPAPDVPSA